MANNKTDTVDALAPRVVSFRAAPTVAIGMLYARLAYPQTTPAEEAQDLLKHLKGNTLQDVKSFMESATAEDAARNTDAEVGAFIICRIDRSNAAAPVIVAKGGINARIFSKLAARAKTNRVIHALFVAYLEKEGATLADIRANNSFYLELDAMQDVYASALSKTRALNLEMEKDLAAALTESEAIGFDAALDYLRREHISKPALGSLAQTETDPDLRGLALRYYYLIDKDAAGVRKNVFAEEVNFRYPALAADVAKGGRFAIRQDAATGERRLDGGGADFLAPHKIKGRTPGEKIFERSA